jgi:hypothetical protein
MKKHTTAYGKLVCNVARPGPTLTNYPADFGKPLTKAELEEIGRIQSKNGIKLNVWPTK